MNHVDVLIIGGGPAGISASIWCKRLNMTHLLIEQEKELGGQLAQIQNRIIDYPGVFEGAGGELKKRFISHINELGGFYLTNSRVQNLDLNKKEVIIEVGEEKREITYSYMIVATGASTRMLGVSGEKEMINRGEIYTASKDAHRFEGKDVVVVGGGDRAFEGAIILANKGARVTLIHRSTQFRARQEYVEPAKAHPNITVLLDCEVVEILGEEKVEGVRVRSKNGEFKNLHATAVFIRLGIKPNSEFLHDYVKTNDKGYILTDNKGKTSNKSIYAIGDICTEPEYSSIATAVGQAMHISKHLSLMLHDKQSE